MDVSQRIDGLNSPEVAHRRQAAEQLALAPDAAAAVSLVRACGDADEQVREWAVAALEQMGAPDAADAVALAELLAAEQGDVRYWSATLLGRLGEQAASAVGPLIRALDADAGRGGPAASGLGAGPDGTRGSSGTGKLDSSGPGR